ncbi:MAG: rhomboid family intramembrane serine protease [Actinomycetota bacterium]
MDETPKPDAAVGGDASGSLEPATAEPEEQTYCYGHPDTPTRLRCSRCDRPICGRCAIPASVGQHCPECVAEARRSAPKVRSAVRAAAPMVVTLLVINVAVFILQELQGEITLRFALRPTEVADGEWWRLLTPLVLHADAWHLAFNCLALYIYGPYVEQAFGHGRFVALYLLSGFFASAVSYALGPVNKLAVGASGAIFGLIGILVVYAYQRRSSTFIRGFLQNLLLIIGINLLIGFTYPFIDNYAHVGGLVAGLALGYGFDQQGKGAPALQAATAVLVFIAGIVLVAYQTLQLA